MKQKLAVAILILIVTAFGYTVLDKSPSNNEISKQLVNWMEQAESFPYNGSTISYHDTHDDSKPALILLHGYPTSSYDWYEIWPVLSEKYRLVAADMLGFGMSDKPNDLYSIGLQTDILEALLKNLGINDVRILAHDYGDNVAQELLARKIEKGANYALEIERVVLLNGGLFPETHYPTTIQSLLVSPVGGVVSAFANKSLFEKNFSRVFAPDHRPGSQELVDQWYLICQNNGHKINHKLSHAIGDRLIHRERWVGALQNSPVPMLFINGLMDPVTGKETVDRYIELVPHPNVIKFDAVGHFPQLEIPDELAQAVLAFFGAASQGQLNSQEGAQPL